MRGQIRTVACALGIALTFPAPAAYAADDWYGPEYQTCSHLPTVDLVQCVGRLSAGWEQRVNELYQELLNYQDSEERRALVRAAQEHWRAYRDATCMWIRSGQGSIAAVEAAECMRAMTKARAQELSE